jgi:hypothetical protein
VTLLVNLKPEQPLQTGQSHLRLGGFSTKWIGYQGWVGTAPRRDMVQMRPIGVQEPSSSRDSLRPRSCLHLSESVMHSRRGFRRARGQGVCIWICVSSRRPSHGCR